MLGKILRDRICKTKMRSETNAKGCFKLLSYFPENIQIQVDTFDIFYVEELYWKRDALQTNPGPFQFFFTLSKYFFNLSH